MANPTLEERVAALEQTVAALAKPAASTGLEAVGGIFKGDPGFAAVVAFGRYLRVTGHEPPPDWQPGDPIPEPAPADESPI